MKPNIIKIFKFLIFQALFLNVIKCIVELGKDYNRFYVFIFNIWFLNMGELSEIKSAYCQINNDQGNGDKTMFLYVQAQLIRPIHVIHTWDIFDYTLLRNYGV